MIPGSTATVTIDTETDQGNAANITLPYDIDANHLGAKQLKTIVNIELGDAAFTPTVDSLLVFYERNGDDGNRLHSANLKGSYCLSLEDYDNSGDTEYSYCLSKYGGWYKLDRAFYNYLPIGDDVVLGVGKNPNETYRNLYKLDEKDIDVWYFRDTTTVDIDTKVQTGYLGYDYITKEYRKCYLTIEGKTDGVVSFNIEAINVASYSEDISLQKTVNISRISLPDTIQGRGCQITIEGDSMDWFFGGYRLKYWEKPFEEYGLPFYITTFYSGGGE